MSNSLIELLINYDDYEPVVTKIQTLPINIPETFPLKFKRRDVLVK